jgi:hypothetical protein
MVKGSTREDSYDLLKSVSTFDRWTAIGGDGFATRFEGGGIVGAALDTNSGVVRAGAFPAADVVRSNARRRFRAH